ncbi:MAG TPA: GNAT family N-acetyltransferase [Xanthobacteraceae bacterium]|nr:GNAT family N-acetyltransferase [Xanthobacteraceae bacterium]
MSDPAYALTVTDAPDAQARATISEGLAAYNDESAGLSDRRDLGVLVKDASGAVIGGIIGRTSLGLLFIDLVYLPAALRRHGLGGRMLKLAEDEGRGRGCVSAMLYTISFQAPDFYARHGWREFGRVPRKPDGAARIFFTKTL